MVFAWWALTLLLTTVGPAAVGHLPGESGAVSGGNQQHGARA